jgi:site-specific DNA-methyltransferase (adenine-specific)
MRYSMRKTEPGFHIEEADALTFLNSLTAFPFDLIITSPPYKKKDGYDLEKFTLIFKRLYYFAREHSLCFVNFGHLAHFKADPFRLALAIEAQGWNWHDTIVWAKNHYTPLPDPNLNNLWEPIFLFSKGKPRLARLAVGEPYADKSNVARYGGGKDLRCAGNIWPVPYETIQNSSEKTHKDRFPVELPRKCILLSGITKGRVYDPFAGSASTGVAALKEGLNFTGTEILPEIAEIARNRLRGIIEA